MLVAAARDGDGGMTKTEMVTTDDQPKRRNGAARDAVLVSGNALATHLGCTRQNVARLTAEAIIERGTA
jgi:hypothetical protein